MGSHELKVKYQYGADADAKQSSVERFFLCRSNDLINESKNCTSSFSTYLFCTFLPFTHCTFSLAIFLDRYLLHLIQFIMQHYFSMVFFCFSAIICILVIFKKLQALNEYLMTLLYNSLFQIDTVWYVIYSRVDPDRVRSNKYPIPLSKQFS